jgi:hypothetical protein
MVLKARDKSHAIAWLFGLGMGYSTTIKRVE